MTSTNYRKYDKRVELQRKVEKGDGAGGSITAGLETYATIWAKLHPLSTFARERMRAGGLGTEVTHEVTIRFREGIENGHFVKWKERSFRIVHYVNVEERNVELVLTCKEEQI